jgi:hypothetical protein
MELSTFFWRFNDSSSVFQPGSFTFRRFSERFWDGFDEMANGWGAEPENCVNSYHLPPSKAEIEPTGAQHT